MSIFKTKWVVLKIHKINTWEFLYTIFTREYWKIICNKKLSKKEKALDLWYLINFEIITKDEITIHKIKNIKILSEFSRDNKSFYQLNTYLIILALILNKTTKWLAIYELFDLLETVNLITNINEIQLILIRLKIISIFWELNEHNSNQTISKILKFINSNKVDRVIKLTWINENIKKELEVI